MSNIIITLKNNLFGCFQNKGEQGGDIETGLREGGGIKMSTTSACHIRDARSPSLLNLTWPICTYMFSFFPWTIIYSWFVSRSIVL